MASPLFSVASLLDRYPSFQRRNRQLQPIQQLNLLNGSRELEQRIEFIRFRQQTDWLLQHGTRDLPFENPGQREIPVGAPARRSIVSGSSGQGNIHMRPPDQRNIPTPAMRDANHWTIRQQGTGTFENRRILPMYRNSGRGAPCSRDCLG